MGRDQALTIAILEGRMFALSRVVSRSQLLEGGVVYEVFTLVAEDKAVVRLYSCTRYQQHANIIRHGGVYSQNM